MNFAGEPKTILVVEDEEAIRTLVEIFMESAGYRVITAINGKEGLALFQEHESSIALLLSDVAMPGMSGLDLADEVLKLKPTLPVLFISGNAQHADRGWGCIAKPFTWRELLGRVRQALDST